MSDVFDPSEYDVAADGPIETTYEANTADGTFTSEDGWAEATAAEHEQTEAWNAESDLEIAKGEAWYAGDTDSYYELADAEADAHQWGQEAYAAEVDATYATYDEPADTTSYDSSTYDTSSSYDSTSYDTSSSYDSSSTYDTSSSYDSSSYDSSASYDSSSSYDTSSYDSAGEY